MIRTVCKFNRLILFTDIIFVPVRFSSETPCVIVALPREKYTFVERHFYVLAAMIELMFLLLDV